MKSALECLRHADHCDGMARASRDDIDRRMLTVAADQWRKLAAGTATHERMIATTRPSREQP